MSISAACMIDARRREACRVVKRFFRAVNSGEFATACVLLGERLREDTHGTSCPKFLAAGVPEPVPFGILGARVSGRVVAVLVVVGQSELDHFRMRHHLAYVGLEQRGLRILATALVR